MEWLKNASGSDHCRPEDIAWLSSRSDSELDMLISIKEMVVQRAKAVGFEEWGYKFDLKMLRAIDVVLREFLKERLTNASIIPESAEGAICPDKFLVLASECHYDANLFVNEDVNDWKNASLKQKKKHESSCRDEFPAVKKLKVEPRD